MVAKPAAKVIHEVEPQEPTGIIGLCPDPKRMYKHSKKINLGVLKKLSYTSVLSADQFDKELLCELCKVAAYLQNKKRESIDILGDKIMAAAFFEASTRTRLSFESAMLRLGGNTISVADAKTTGVAKGESLIDIGQMFNSYADLVVVRHTEQSSIHELSKYMRVPLINGGNGSDEHPTQALADWYALLKWKPAIAYNTLPENEKIHLGIIGTPGNMRSVKSFLLLSLLFKDNIKQISIVSEMADPLGEDVQVFCDNSPVPINIINDLQEVVSDLDVIYMNMIAFLGDGYRDIGSSFHLSNKTKLKKDAVVMHPLARKEELDESLDDTPHNLYFNQADGAVYIRQALLLAIFDRIEKIIPQELLQ